MKCHFLVLSVFIFLCLGITEVQAQQDEGFVRTEDKMRKDLTYGGVIEQTAPRPKKNLGTHYYDPRWRAGTLELFDGSEAKQVLMKYELRNHQLELVFKGGDKPRSIRPELVKRFEWRESAIRQRVFINPKLMQFQMEDKEIKGFMEVLYKNEYSLYAHHTAEFDEGHYVPIFDIGERDNKWKKDVTLWLEHEGKIYQFPNRRKRIIELFSRLGKDISDVKFRKFNYKKPDGARSLFRFIHEGY